MSLELNIQTSKEEQESYKTTFLLVLISALLAIGTVGVILAFPSRYYQNLYVYFSSFGLIKILSLFIIARLFPKIAKFDMSLKDNLRHDIKIAIVLFIAMLFCDLLAVLFFENLGVNQSFNWTRLGVPVGGDIYCSGYINFILSFIVIVLITPFSEELFFRGYLQDILSRIFNPKAALLFQAILFGLCHGPVISKMVYTFMLGIIFGMWREKNRTLFPLILAHLLLNATGFMLHIVRFKAGWA